MKEFVELLAIMHRLRLECPWDREQDLKSLRKFLLEEAYECVGAIDEIALKGLDPLIEELGDVLLQVVFQSEIISEQLKTEVISRVIRTLNEKLVRRHPHVFGDQKLDDAQAVLDRWNEIKRGEKEIPENPSHLDGISKALTALQLAYKYGERSKKVQFDWAMADEVWRQVDSEIEELKTAEATATAEAAGEAAVETAGETVVDAAGAPDAADADEIADVDEIEHEIEHEFGDVLFTLVQWGRHKKLEAETALARANRRFESRFKKMEAIARNEGRNFDSISVEEKEKLWQLAKLDEKRCPATSADQ